MTLLQELKSGGEGTIERWIRESRIEDIHFDCKKKSDSGSPVLNKEDRKNLGKALSAFANSDGGLLLWGVDARKKDKDGVDCLDGKDPIMEVDVFSNNVQIAIADLVNPPIPDLEFQVIPSAQADGMGYLAISIPVSEKRPHMSRNNPEPGFFFRHGHKSVLMEVFQVRDQMLRKAIPKLNVVWDAKVKTEEISLANAKRHTIPVSVRLVLKNDSLTSARFPYLVIRVNRARYLSMGAAYQAFAQRGLSIVRSGPIEGRNIETTPGSFLQDTEFAGGADCCIHPGTSLMIASIMLEVPVNVNNIEGHDGSNHKELSPRYGELPTIFIEVSYGCLNTICERVFWEIKAADMFAKLSATGQGGVITV